MPSRISTTPDDAARFRGGRVETNTLLARWREHGDGRARDALVERFMPLARRLASRYAGQEPMEDLVQVAAVGLLCAIDRFDPDRAVAFPAYAIPTILGEIKRHFRNTGWAVHVPRGSQEMALRVSRATQEITTRSARPPRIQELAEYLEVSTENVLSGLDAGMAHFAASLDAPLAAADSDEPWTLIDGMGDAEDGYGLVEMTASLGVAITRLPYLERRALCLRLEQDVKQSEIAAQLGCSQMQVSRLLRRATTRLREMIDPPAGPAGARRDGPVVR
ncbi:MAG TPA: SigB/SigF/SigG family RNA polymerase sigma factor [Solirubrobacteraceae bacterium]|jgi:RNA polymerase sigma-B factor|nr:SigB/SigF/SigG family RNA polymerase sigma factor [Solirubrobacteraceae bacterium]